jgi:hypothetical protein
MSESMRICFVISILLSWNVLVINASERVDQTQSAAFGNARGVPNYLTHSNSAEKTPDPNGFIQRWLLLEPIRQQSLRSNQQLTDSFVQAAVKREYFPNQFTVIPHDGDKVTVDGIELTWHAVDTSKYNVNLFTFAYVLDKPTYNVLFWAVTIINCPQEISNVRLSVGSNAASVWWFNDKEVIGIYGDRHMLLDDGVSKRLTLKKGSNVVRCAVINAPGVSDFCARFLDSDGKPLKEGFTISVSDTGK